MPLTSLPAKMPAAPAALMEIKCTDPARPEQIITWKGELIDYLRTDKTTIILLNTPTYGNILFMDGSVQSSQLDQAAYHRALVAPAARAANIAGRAAIVLGGGEGCTAAEALRAGAASVTQIDHDGQAIDWARRMLADWNEGVYDDPRVRVIIDDAFALGKWGGNAGIVAEKSAALIVVDLFDPDTSTLGDYIQLVGCMVDRYLAAGGLLVAYYGLWPSAEGLTWPSGARGYVKYIPSFCSECLFLVAGDRAALDRIVLEPDMRWVF